MTRLYPVSRMADKEYVFNHRFELKAKWDEGSIWNGSDFEVVGRTPDQHYFTQGGPSFSSSAHSYACDELGLRGAVRRLTAKREPGIPGLHEWLITCQYTFMMDNPYQDEYDEFIRRRVLSTFVPRTHREMKFSWADAPHKNRKRRLNAYTVLQDTGRLHSYVPKAVNYFCKAKELLKPGYMRAVASLPDKAACASGYIAPMFKDAMTCSFVNRAGYEAQFIASPDLSNIAEVGQKLLHNRSLYFAYYSDDSCLSINWRGTPFIWNVDISKCDGSHFSPLFERLKNLLSIPYLEEDVELAFEQLTRPLFLNFGKYGTVRRFAHVDPFGGESYVAMSGSTWTTVFNNYACQSIFSALTMLIISRYGSIDNVPSRTDLESLILMAAERMGYIVTCQFAEHPEDIQFLKHSFTIVDGVVQPWVNLGCYLRKFGLCYGDVQGSKEVAVERRMALFNSEVIRGRVFWGEHAFRRAFDHMICEERGKLGQYELDDLAKFSNEKGWRQAEIPTQALALRYRIPHGYLLDLIATIQRCKQGDLVRHPAVDSILELDYDIPVSPFGQLDPRQPDSASTSTPF